ncbi:hypothetical protein HNP71_002759 [Acidocella aromatica]|uniref:Uncharacterized protein n=1 Tax=Acidocella aromatica TaxID=1303579 RepID=A0A840VMY6_9PROT|nr:hypothetical protein [Acidocella aromatica]MBB5374485.1 hypothetical protein [Acidocella aromatica]
MAGSPAGVGDVGFEALTADPNGPPEPMDPKLTIANGAANGGQRQAEQFGGGLDREEGRGRFRGGGGEGRHG